MAFTYIRLQPYPFFQRILTVFSLLSTQLACAQEMPKPKVPGQSPPEKLPPFVSAVQARPKEKLPPLPPEKRVGFAVVGLGRLALEEILPAFGQCQLARPVAVMTGDPKGKGQRVVAEFGIKSEAVYGYDEFEKLAQSRYSSCLYRFCLKSGNLSEAKTLQLEDQNEFI